MYLWLFEFCISTTWNRMVVQVLLHVPLWAMHINVIKRWSAYIETEASPRCTSWWYSLWYFVLLVRIYTLGDNLHCWWHCGGNRRIACPLLLQLLHMWWFHMLQCAPPCYNCTMMVLQWRWNKCAHLAHCVMPDACDQADWITCNFLSCRHSRCWHIVQSPLRRLILTRQVPSLSNGGCTGWAPTEGHDPDYSGTGEVQSVGSVISPS